MVGYGLSELEAIGAATRNVAENMDTLHDTGTVEVGKLADLVLVEGDPVADISAVREVRMVVQDGDIVRNDTADQVAR